MLIYLEMIDTDEEQSKFEQIYLEYRDLMYYVAYKHLKNEQDAEDVVHHAFIKIAEHIKKVEPVSPKTRRFVITIVENRVIDLYRVRLRHPEVSFVEEHYLVQEPPETNDLLQRCIHQLPTIQQQVIGLKYGDGYNLREIAQMLGISLAWARKIDQRAKNTLRKLYEEGLKCNDNR